MLIILSPAKSLDYKSPSPITQYSQPDFLEEAQQLVKILSEYSPAQMATLMRLSDKLATLGVTRMAEWSRPFTHDNAKQAVLAFNGDVYEGLTANTLTEEDLRFTQSHLRILSGLYGVLRPLDLMQAYRLEMGTKLAHPMGKNLYDFWGDRITQALGAQIKALETEGEQTSLINLASDEYFKAVKPQKLTAKIIQPVFEDWNKTQYKIISFYAKRARGLMSRYAIKNKITDAQALKDFDSEGYAFCPTASDETRWVFRRKPL